AARARRAGLRAAFVRRADRDSTLHGERPDRDLSLGALRGPVGRLAGERRDLLDVGLAHRKDRPVPIRTGDPGAVLQNRLDAGDGLSGRDQIDLVDRLFAELLRDARRDLPDPLLLDPGGRVLGPALEAVETVLQDRL